MTEFETVLLGLISLSWVKIAVMAWRIRKMEADIQTLDSHAGKSDVILTRVAEIVGLGDVSEVLAMGENEA